MGRHVIHHEGRHTAYRVEDSDGAGRPALFVHGPGSSRNLWIGQRSLADDRPIAALDLSGHGDSANIDAASGWETMSAYASDVLAVAREIDAGFLIGHSLGAAVLIHLVDRRPVDPQGLVLFGLGSRLPIPEDFLRMASTDLEELISWLHEPGRLFYDPDEPARSSSIEAMKACQPGVVRRDLETCDHIDLRTALPGVAVPALVLCGEYDRLTPPHECSGLADALPAGSFVSIERAAHLPMLERPEATNATLREFVRDPQTTGNISP